MNTAYLGLGSNLGDRRQLLRDAIVGLARDAAIRVVKLSPVYETKPVGLTDQPDFLNMVVQVETTLHPRELLARGLQLETELGRVRREHWGPRTLDVDVLWYDGRTWCDSELILPHPRLTERAFVLVPLAELAPELVLDGETVAARAARLDGAGLRRLGPLEMLSA